MLQELFRHFLQFLFILHCDNEFYNKESKILWLTLKIPGDQKLVVFYLGTLWEEKNLQKKSYVGQVNYVLHKLFGIPNMSNSDSVWACGELLFKMDCKFIFHVLYEGLLHVAKLAQGLQGRLPKKKFVLSIESWIFNFCLWSWFCMMPIPM
jgi:hypothetical protein